MKYGKILVVMVLSCLLFGGCGRKKDVSGYVTHYETGSISITTKQGKTYDFVLEEPESILTAVEGLNREIFQTEWQDCYAHVTYQRKRGENYAETVFVHHKIYRNAMELSDGTSIDIWTDGLRREYWLEDGTVLLVEENTGSPENYYRWNELAYYEDFPEAAQQGILDYYAEMGQRYDISALLEDAYLVYGVSKEYNTQMVSQYTGIEAWNDRIICCQVNLTLPQERSNGGHDAFCEGAVFDRQTGEQISNYDLFTLNPEELEGYLLDVLDADGTLDRESIRLNLKPEQIVLQRDGGITFYLVDKMEKGAGGVLYLCLSPEQATEILQPWAVVQMEE